jgi:hypothetical protein
MLYEIWRQFGESYTSTLVPILRTASSLRSVKCGPGRIQCKYSSAYSGINIQVKVSAMILVIYRQFNMRYSANIEPNTAYIIQFTQCVLWSRTYTKYLQLLIVMPQYSTEPDCAATTDMPTFGCALYCKLGVKYSPHPPVYALWTVVPVIYKTYIAPHIQASIFNWMYLRCYWKCLDDSMLVILQTCCQIHRTSIGLRYANCSLTSIFIWTHLCCCRRYADIWNPVIL